MIKCMFIGRRAAGTTRKGAHGHLRDVHAKMVVCPPPGAGPMPSDYVQNHVMDGAYPGTGAHAIERDLVTELWFDSIDQLHASTTTAYYLANLRPDEPRFVDDATVAKMIVRPTVLIESVSGRFKTFAFVRRGDADDAAWASTRKRLASALTGAAGLVENVVLPPPTGERPFVDLALEGWFEAADDAASAMDAALSLIAGTDAIDRSGSFVLTAEQYDTQHLRKLHECPIGMRN